jgi:DNA-binding transcriptional regulator YhcF (GntR family)
MIHFDLLADIALTRINNPIAKVVLLSIAKHANAKGECFPSRDTISHDSCVPLRSVVRAIQWLEEHGYIRIVPRSGTSNFYIITSMEEEMEDDDTRATVAHEVDSNITRLDITKKRTANYTTTSGAKSAHPSEDPFFLAFWQAYPRRIGKGEARTAFLKASAKTHPNMIVQAALTYAQFVQDMGVEPKFIPHPSTWLNAERWEDDLETEKVDRKQKTGWDDVFNDL